MTNVIDAVKPIMMGVELQKRPTIADFRLHNTVINRLTKVVTPMNMQMMSLLSNDFEGFYALYDCAPITAKYLIKSGLVTRKTARALYVGKFAKCSYKKSNMLEHCHLILNKDVSRVIHAELKYIHQLENIMYFCSL
jgi:hypothetical protein